MGWENLLEKEFYIVDCKDFVYFVRTVHILGIQGSCVEEPLLYMIDDKVTLTKEELERFKTKEEAQKYAYYLNELPENKKMAEEWNSRDKFLFENM